MNQTCNFANLYAAARAAVSPVVKGGLFLVAGLLSFGAILYLSILVAHPVTVRTLVLGEHRSLFIAELVALTGLIVYGLVRDAKTTLFMAVATVTGVAFVLGLNHYQAWVSKIVPDFGFYNMPAIFEVRNVSWLTHLELLPVQLLVGLEILIGLGMFVAGVAYVAIQALSEACRYGARVRDGQAKPATR